MHIFVGNAFLYVILRSQKGIIEKNRFDFNA